MGVQISIYKENVKVNNSEDYDFIVSNSEYYNDRAIGYKNGDKYKSKNITSPLKYRCGEHNKFRDNLARIIDKPFDFWRSNHVNVNLPFHEMFESTDSNTTFCHANSLELYKDFKNYLPIAKEILSFEDYAIYVLWMDIFNKAKDNGVVIMN
jgi:hypothetical protein